MVVFVASAAESGHTLTFRLYADSSSERKVRLLLRMVALRGTFFNLTVSLGGVHVHSSPGESVGSAGPSVRSFRCCHFFSSDCSELKYGPYF